MNVVEWLYFVLGYLLLHAVYCLVFYATQITFIVDILILLTNIMCIIWSGTFSSQTTLHIHTGRKSPTDPEIVTNHFTLPNNIRPRWAGLRSSQWSVCWVFFFWQAAISGAGLYSITLNNGSLEPFRHFRAHFLAECRYGKSQARNSRWGQALSTF